jgi:hypothetical protein
MSYGRRIIGVILFVVAVLMFAGAILSTVTSIKLRANGVRTTAAILNVSTHFSRHSATSGAAVRVLLKGRWSASSKPC